MNENLNLCEILKGCPTGTKLWSPVWGNMTLIRINNESIYPIVLSADGFNNVSLHSDGRMYGVKESECILFPSKEQRDWSKFKVPTEESKVSVKRFNPEEFKPFDKVLIRDGKGNNWIPGFFEKLLKQSNGDCLVVDFRRYSWYMCIPYNDETKHLLETREDCPEYYKWWKE